MGHVTRWLALLVVAALAMEAAMANGFWNAVGTVQGGAKTGRKPPKPPVGGGGRTGAPMLTPEQQQRFGPTMLEFYREQEPSSVLELPGAQETFPGQFGGTGVPPSFWQGVQQLARAAPAQAPAIPANLLPVGPGGGLYQEPSLPVGPQAPPEGPAAPEEDKIRHDVFAPYGTWNDQWADMARALGLGALGYSGLGVNAYDAALFALQNYYDSLAGTDAWAGGTGGGFFGGGGGGGQATNPRDWWLNLVNWNIR